MPHDANSPSPFHSGEQEMQRRAGKREMAETLGRRMIRDFMPDQHREFFAQLPFLAAGAVDDDGWPWANLLSGPPGFATSPNPQHLQVSLDGAAQDPVRAAIREGAVLGLLGIELHSRRRNRLNGRVTAAGPDGFKLRTDQSFGNCPQYIHPRELRPAETQAAAEPQSFTSLGPVRASQIASADMFFVASHVPAGRNPEREGADISHRGGRPGFVRVEGNTLTIPDFKGNNHFNTLGNFLVTPRAGLAFPDFSTGTLLLLTGTVEILSDTDPEVLSFDGAQRGWRFKLCKGLQLSYTLPWRAGPVEYAPQTLRTGIWQGSTAEPSSSG